MVKFGLWNLVNDLSTAFSITWSEAVKTENGVAYIWYAMQAQKAFIEEKMYNSNEL